MITGLYRKNSTAEKAFVFFRQPKRLKNLFLLLCSLNALFCFAQKNYGASLDYYIYQNSSNSLVPLAFYDTKNNLHAGVRYNYESDRTLSLQFGKTFSKEGKLSYSLLPMAGLLAGDFNGLSAATQLYLEAGKFSLYSEPEYCFHFSNADENFFYNWTELAFQPCGVFKAGLALQTIKSRLEPFVADPGVMVVFSIQKFELPFYFFKPSASSSYFVAGIHWAFEK